MYMFAVWKRNQSRNWTGHAITLQKGGESISNTLSFETLSAASSGVRCIYKLRTAINLKRKLLTLASLYENKATKIYERYCLTKCINVL